MRGTLAIFAIAAVTAITGCEGDDDGAVVEEDQDADGFETFPPLDIPGSMPSVDLPPADVGNQVDPDAYKGVVRFVALGDGGEGNDNQYAVADIVEQVCSQRGCDFAIYLGDNFYDIGVMSVLDEQFQDKFELPYGDLDLLFYITLGNHDYGVLGNEWMLSEFQVEYSNYSGKWELPSPYYTFDRGHVTFVSLDTARMFWNFDVPPQRELLRAALDHAAGSRWTIAFGHHPYLSNGSHGNAGNYEGTSISTIRGKNIKDFFDPEVCGKVTVYFSGHDHNRQWHRPPAECETHFIVSGAAAKTKGFEDRDQNPTPLFAEADTPGFAWVEIIDDTMRVAFYDTTGAKNFEDSVTLEPPAPALE